MQKLLGLGVTICLLAGSACFGMTATNGLQLDITWPWPIKLELSWPSNFTHAVDVYYCDDLRTAQWQYLMAGEATTGLEALVIT